ncbi:MAG TPA: OmpA family protein [Steroidobacteraceae bacterium]|nr:OmpA family protein [Steroidobacteraceae bacterium]
MATMLDSILGMVTPEMKQALASRLGEPAQSVQTGLGTATAATLGGLANKAGDSGFLSQVLGLLGGSAGGNILGNLSSILSSGPSGATGDLVNKFLPMVFGSQQGQVASAISQQAGLSNASGSGLLKVAAPLVLGYLAKMQSAGSLNVSSLGSMLRAEAPSLQSVLPSGLLSGAASTVSATAGRAASAVQAGVGAATTRSSRWIVPLAIIGALLLAWLLIRSLNAPKEIAQSATNAGNAAVNAVNNAANSAWSSLGEIIVVSLPDGSKLNAPTLGVENKLVSYLNDASAGVSEDKWFDFDRLLFDTGSATLQPASQDQLADMAAILKAYPGVKIRIGGYTDNTGDPAANLKLSQDRADSVMAELVKLGIDPSRISAKGYGDANPIADNSTEEGRQKNRRISLRVTDKPTGAS